MKYCNCTLSKNRKSKIDYTVLYISVSNTDIAKIPEPFRNNYSKLLTQVRFEDLTGRLAPVILYYSCVWCAGEEVWLYNTPISEDCLYLSIVRPAGKSTTPLPVMVSYGETATNLLGNKPIRRQTL